MPPQLTFVGVHLHKTLTEQLLFYDDPPRAFRDLESLQFSMSFHDTILQRAKKVNACGACQRMFKDQREFQIFENYASPAISQFMHIQSLLKEEF